MLQRIPLVREGRRGGRWGAEVENAVGVVIVRLRSRRARGRAVQVLVEVDEVVRIDHAAAVHVRQIDRLGVLHLQVEL